MNVFHVLILSIIEGFTEFLPVSSTGHLILTTHLLGIVQTEFIKSFELYIQLGAILAALLLYRKTFQTKRALTQKTLVAFLPTGIVGFLFYKLIKTYLLASEIVTIIALIAGGIVLIVFELRWKQKRHHASLDSLTYRSAFLIGFMQSLAMIPGISRSGATIIAALLLGFTRTAAVEFSFLLAIPTLFVAVGFDMQNSAVSFSRQEYWFLMLGITSSFLVAYTTMKYFLRFIRSHSFIPFGIYRIVAGIAYWIAY